MKQVLTRGQMAPLLVQSPSLTCRRVLSYHGITNSSSVRLDAHNIFNLRFDMTKHLLVMRHAKSSWSNGGLSDFDRPLNKRGLRVAPQMAEFIQKQGLIPDLIVSSAASRAKETAELFVENCHDLSAAQLSITHQFYHAPAKAYFDYLRNFSDESVQKLMFVGHNPGMEELVQTLSGRWEIMPTAAVAHFDLELENWADISDAPFRATLENLWRPKEIQIL